MVHWHQQLQQVQFVLYLPKKDIKRKLKKANNIFESKKNLLRHNAKKETEKNKRVKVIMKKQVMDSPLILVHQNLLVLLGHLVFPKQKRQVLDLFVANILDTTGLVIY